MPLFLLTPQDPPKSIPMTLALISCVAGYEERLGLAASSKKLEYNARLLERWEPEEATLISSGEFEQQFTTFTMRVFYSLCRNFVEANERVLVILCNSTTTFSDDDNPQQTFICAAASYLQGILRETLPDIVVSQIIRGMIRESARFLQQHVAARRELCGVDAGLQLKMNWTMVLHAIRENATLSPYYTSIEEEMQLLHSLANLLVSMGNFSIEMFPSGTSLLESFPFLDPSGIADILEHYSCGEGSETQALALHKANLVEEIRSQIP